ncbi:hypothetical protein H6777_00010 [Candidatus Nomurabacteria bacterium]|nr:hypothetical protein [Candidatus Nomurabacteria bacterium]
MKQILALTALIFALTTAQAQDIIFGVDNELVWGKENVADVTTDLKFKAKVKPKSLTVGYDSPNGIKFNLLFEKAIVNLRYVMEFGNEKTPFYGLSEFGDCMERYYVSIAIHDFDGDKNPEIIVVVGDGLLDLWANVIKYHPPSKEEDAIRTENWTTVASFGGQDKIYVENGVITVPIGSQGLYEEYTWVNGKFVKTN